MIFYCKEAGRERPRANRSVLAAASPFFAGLLPDGEVRWYQPCFYLNVCVRIDASLMEWSARWQSRTVKRMFILNLFCDLAYDDGSWTTTCASPWNWATTRRFGCYSMSTPAGSRALALNATQLCPCCAIFTSHYPAMARPPSFLAGKTDGQLRSRYWSKIRRHHLVCQFLGLAQIFSIQLCPSSSKIF